MTTLEKILLNSFFKDLELYITKFLQTWEAKQFLRLTPKKASTEMDECRDCREAGRVVSSELPDVKYQDV